MSELTQYLPTDAFPLSDYAASSVVVAAAVVAAAVVAAASVFAPLTIAFVLQYGIIMGNYFIIQN